MILMDGLLTTFNSGYVHDCKLFYLLLNLVDEETRRKYLYQTDERTLADALIAIDKSCSIDEAKRRAYNLVLNFARFQYESPEFKSQEFEDYSDKEIYDILNYYYKIKFGHTIPEDLNSVLVFFDDHDTIYDFGESGKIEIENDERDDLLYQYVENSLPLSDALQESFNLSYSTINEMTARPKGLFTDSIIPTIYCTQDGERKSMIIDSNAMRQYTKTYNNQVVYWDGILKD